MKQRWLKLAAVPLAFTLAAAACGTEDEADDTQAPGGTGDTDITGGTTGVTSGSGEADLEGTEVTVFGPESSDEEAGAMQDALDVFAQENGMTITYVGARDFEEQINSQVSGGNPPDISIFPQPGKLRDFAQSEDLIPLPDDVLASVTENWDEQWLGFWQTEDGTQYGVPNKSDLKSLVWYSPATFDEKGYEVPETLDDFFALNEEMIANGDTPLCVGIESGPATGWPFTDWTEDVILRNEGIDYYNQWVNHDVPFNDPPEVVDMTCRRSPTCG